MGSRMRTGVLGVALVLGVLAIFAVRAQEPGPKADPVHGKAISYTCLGCHGVPGYKNAYPNYSVPELRGQHPEYLIAALQEYKSGERSHFTMHSQAEELSDQDMADIAAYFAGTPLTTGHAPAAPVPPTVAVCASCHGADGVGITALYPTLAGQHADYLARALDEYQKGARKNAIMANFAAHLTSEQVEAIADFFSKEQPSLQTVPRPSTRISEE
jgi:cytochrome c553